MILVFGLAGFCQAAETNRVPAEVVFPKSVFIDDPNGKDPFFPNRQRGGAPKPVVDTALKEPNWKALQLRGITGNGDKRVALINNLTFAKGEEGEVKIPPGKTVPGGKIVPGGKLRVKVLEIKEKSVIISIEGLPDEKELLLTERLLGVE